MKINFLQATSTAVLLWILIFVAISIIMFIPAFAANFKILMLAVQPFLIFLCAYFYFRKNEGTTLRGLFIGIYYLIISVVLDLVITIPLFVKSYEAYYKDWILWAGFGEVLLFTILAANLIKVKVQIPVEAPKVQAQVKKEAAPQVQPQVLVKEKSAAQAPSENNTAISQVSETSNKIEK